MLLPAHDAGDPSLQQTAHRPWPMPDDAWRLRQRWTKLLFAHWPMPADVIQRRLPAGLRVDTHDGWAWLGVVPFLMDQVRFRTLGDRGIGLPTATQFPELNLRTYCIAPDGRRGVYFLSLDAGSLLAVLGARIGFGLPYFWSRMRLEQRGDAFRYTSTRLLGRPANFAAQYRSLGMPAAPDAFGHFVTHRYAFFLRRFGQVQAGEIHHAPWALERGEIEFEQNGLAAGFGLTLPKRPPVVHYAGEVHMQAWLLRRVRESPRP